MNEEHTTTAATTTTAAAAPAAPAATTPAPSPASVRAAHEPLEGIHDLPVAQQIERYRTLHDDLAARLATEGE